tara:strand:- start:9303 stop:10700 length:1398 start_codon:yes stop_codon:yes gene_type:complete
LDKNYKTKLINSTIIYSIGNFSSKLLIFLLLPLYTLYLSKEEFGVYDILLTTIYLLIPILSFQISQSLYRWMIYSDNDKYNSIILSTAFFFLLTTCILLFFTLELVNIFLKIKFFTYYNLFIFLSILTPFFLQTTRSLKKLKLFAISGISISLMILLFSIIFLKFLNLGLRGVLLSYILSYSLLIVFILFSAKLFGKIKLYHFSFKLLKKLTRYSLPLIPNTISWWLTNAGNKYLITIFLGLEFTGVFGVASRFPSILVIINSIFMLSWQDLLLSTDKNDLDQSKVSSILNTFVSFELSTCLVLICSSSYLCKYFISSTYSEVYQYLPFLFLSTSILAFNEFLGVFYMKQKQTKQILYTTLFGAIINIAITLLLMKYIGLFAPIIGSIIGFSVIFLQRYKQLKRKYLSDFTIKYYIPHFIVLIFVCLLVIYSNTDYHIYFIVMSIPIFIYFNKRILLTIKAKIFK